MVDIEGTLYIQTVHTGNGSMTYSKAEFGNNVEAESNMTSFQENNFGNISINLFHIIVLVFMAEKYRIMNNTVTLKYLLSCFFFK